MEQDNMSKKQAKGNVQTVTIGGTKYSAQYVCGKVRKAINTSRWIRIEVSGGIVSFRCGKDMVGFVEGGAITLATTNDPLRLSRSDGYRAGAGRRTAPALPAKESAALQKYIDDNMLGKQYPEKLDAYPEDLEIGLSDTMRGVKLAGASDLETIIGVTEGWRCVDHVHAMASGRLKRLKAVGAGIHEANLGVIRDLGHARASLESSLPHNDAERSGVTEALHHVASATKCAEEILTAFGTRDLCDEGRAAVSSIHSAIRAVNDMLGADGCGMQVSKLASMAADSLESARIAATGYQHVIHKAGH